MKRRLLPVLLAMSIAGLTTATHAALSERTWQRLGEIHALIQEQQFPEAVAALDELSERTRGNPHEQALVLEARATLEERRDEPEAALALIDEALALSGVPTEARLQLRYTQARLLLAAGRATAALAVMDDWFEEVREPAPRAVMLRAAVYAELGREQEAIAAARDAIERSRQPRAGWYGFLVGLLLTQEDYAGAAPLLERMVAHWPLEARYWEQLAAVRMYVDDQAGALAALRLAHAHGLLEREATIVRLVRLAVAEGLPEPGGRLLEAALDKEMVARSGDHLELLGNAWLQAREWDRATSALERAAELAEDGELYVQVARIALERQDARAAVDMLSRALERGVEDPAGVRLLQGMAWLEMDALDEAVTAFRRAQEDEDVAPRAGQWLRYVEAVRENSGTP